MSLEDSKRKYNAKEAYSRQDAVDSYDANRFTSPGGKVFDSIEKNIVLSNIPKERGVSVLDVGTGTGRFAVELAKCGLNVAACDISSPMLRTARGKLLKMNLEGKVTLINGDIYHLPFKDNVFGYVVCLRVLDNLGTRQNEKVALEELCRVCSYGGTVLFDFVNLYSLAILNRSHKIALSSVKEIREYISNIPNITITRIESKRLIPQTLFEVFPKLFLRFLQGLDSWLSTFLPNFGIRIYFILTKELTNRKKMPKKGGCKDE